MAEPLSDPIHDITPGPDGNVVIAGLAVPAELAVRIVAALRGLYPDQTASLSDGSAVRAILRHWITSTLTTWEAQQITAPATEQAAQIQEQARQRAQQATEAVRKAAEAIRDAATAD